MGNEELRERPRLAIWISGRGTGMKSILDAITADRLHADVVLVVSSSAQAGGLAIAQAAGIRTEVVSHRGPEMTPRQGELLLHTFEEMQVDLQILTGYIKRVPARIVHCFSGRMLNIHPALLPDFGGAGMYGMRVHEAVIASGARLSGATVHLVTEVYDEGEIIAQQTVPVEPNDSPETLASRVQGAEHQLYPAALEAFIKSRHTRVS